MAGALSSGEENGPSQSRCHIEGIRKIYHANFLKKWVSPSALCLLTDEADEDEEEFPDWREKETSQPIFGIQLTNPQREELRKL